MLLLEIPRFTFLIMMCVVLYPRAVSGNTLALFAFVIVASLTLVALVNLLIAIYYGMKDWISNN